MSRNNWTRNELLLALNLYCKLPFSKFSSSTPEIIRLAEIIGRTPIAMKLSNFASLDTSLPQSGLENASKLDREIWNEFTGDWNQIAVKSEEILDQLISTDGMSDTEDGLDIPQLDTETTQTVKIRLGQRFFRSSILGNYNTRCCICDLPIASLLIASHIIPWSVDEQNRLNPQNGMSLCVIHDKAFDRGYLTIDKDFQVLLGSKLLNLFEHEAVERYFIHYQHKPITMPEKFTPKQEFLSYHRDHIFLP